MKLILKSITLVFCFSLLSAQSLTFNPTALDFGEVVWGQSLSLQIQVTNDGTEMIEVNSITPSSSDFSVVPGTFQISPGELILLTVIYLPSSEGTFSETLTFSTSEEEYSYDLSAVSLNLPIFGPAPLEFNFDVIQADDSLETQTLTITNHGQSELTWEANGISVEEGRINGRKILISGYNSFSYAYNVESAIERYINNNWAYDGNLVDMDIDIWTNNHDWSDFIEAAYEYDMVIFPYNNYFTYYNENNETEGLELKEYMESGHIVMFSSLNDNTTWNIIDYSQNGGAGFLYGDVYQYTSFGNNNYSNQCYDSNWYIYPLETYNQDLPFWNNSGGNINSNPYIYYGYSIYLPNSAESQLDDYWENLIPIHRYSGWGDGGWISFAHLVGDGLFLYQADREPNSSSNNNYEAVKYYVNLIQWALKNYSFPKFLTISDESGTVAPLSSIDISITADTRDLEYGPYTSSFSISTNDPYYGSHEFPVTLEVRGPVVNPEPDSLVYDIYPAYDNALTQPLIIHNDGWADLIWETDSVFLPQDDRGGEMNILIYGYNSSSYAYNVEDAINRYQDNNWTYDGNLIDMNVEVYTSSSDWNTFRDYVELNNFDVIIFPHENYFTLLNGNDEEEGLWIKHYMQSGHIVMMSAIDTSTPWNIMDYNIGSDNDAGFLYQNANDYTSFGSNSQYENHAYNYNWPIPSLEISVQDLPFWESNGGNIDQTPNMYYGNNSAYLQNSSDANNINNYWPDLIPIYNYCGWCDNGWISFAHLVGDGLFLYSAERQPDNSSTEDWASVKHYVNLIQWAYKSIGYGPAGTLTLSEVNGTVPVGDSQILDATMNVEGSNYGIYEEVITITNNDPYTPSIDVPVTAYIYYPISEIDTSTVEFGNVGFTDTTSIYISITNHGNYFMEVFSSLNDSVLSLSADTLIVEPDSTEYLDVIISTNLDIRTIADQVIISTTEIGFPDYVIDINASIVPDLNPVILSINDRPDDQGGYAYITFTRSYHDTSNPQNDGSDDNSDRETEGYGVWCQIDDSWISVASLYAMGENNYTVLVPTAADSTSTTDAIYYYKISANMDEGTWVSDIGSGYSVDNINPSTPTLAYTQMSGANIEVGWGSISDNDFAYFQLYRNGEPLVTSTELNYLDEDPPYGELASYVISAFDIHENESELSASLSIDLNVGDVNSDDVLNVLDLIVMVELILYGEGEVDADLAQADVNLDGVIDILDIVLLMNIILEQNESLGRVITELTLKVHSKGVSHFNDASVVYQFTLRHSGNIEFELTQDALVSKLNTEGNQTEIIIINPKDGWLFQTDQTFEIVELKAASGESFVDVNMEYIPDNFSLSPAYPNPFNPQTRIEYGIPEEGFVKVAVYDMQGREVAVLVENNHSAGYHSVSWNASAFSSGVYLVKMESRQFSDLQKIMLIK